jgi:hypothetical protein
MTGVRFGSRGKKRFPLSAFLDTGGCLVRRLCLLYIRPTDPAGNPPTIPRAGFIFDNYDRAQKEGYSNRLSEIYESGWTSSRVGQMIGNDI